MLLIEDIDLCIRNKAADLLLNFDFKDTIPLLLPRLSIKNDQVRNAASRGFEILLCESNCKEQVLDYFGCRIGIMGAGVMGERALMRLERLGHPDLVIINRTLARAKALAEQYQVTSLALSELDQHLHEFDILIAATSARTPILNRAQMADARPRLMVDLGVPRNIDPQIHTQLGVPIITVGDLKSIADRNIKSRKDELGQVELILREECQAFERWLNYKMNACVLG